MQYINAKISEQEFGAHNGAMMWDFIDSYVTENNTCNNEQGVSLNSSLLLKQAMSFSLLYLHSSKSLPATISAANNDTIFSPPLDRGAAHPCANIHLR